MVCLGFRDFVRFSGSDFVQSIFLMLKNGSNTGVCFECSLIIIMYLIYLNCSDALWYTHVLLQALLKTQDLDTRGHLSQSQGESFSEGATVLCWAGLTLHQVTSLRLQWQFLLCIFCTWIQTSANWEAKTLTTLRGRVQKTSSKLKIKQEPVQSLPCCSPAKPAAPAQEAERGCEHSPRLGDANGS